MSTLTGMTWFAACTGAVQLTCCSSRCSVVVLYRNETPMMKPARLWRISGRAERGEVAETWFQRCLTDLTACAKLPSALAPTCKAAASRVVSGSTCLPHSIVDVGNSLRLLKEACFACTEWPCPITVSTRVTVHSGVVPQGGFWEALRALSGANVERPTLSTIRRPWVLWMVSQRRLKLKNGGGLKAMGA